MQEKRLRRGGRKGRGIKEGDVGIDIDLSIPAGMNKATLGPFFLRLRNSFCITIVKKKDNAIEGIFPYFSKKNSMTTMLK